jgi:hypothetical protein
MSGIDWVSRSPITNTGLFCYSEDKSNELATICTEDFSTQSLEFGIIIL